MTMTLTMTLTIIVTDDRGRRRWKVADGETAGPEPRKVAGHVTPQGAPLVSSSHTSSSVSNQITYQDASSVSGTACLPSITI